MLSRTAGNLTLTTIHMSITVHAGRRARNAVPVLTFPMYIVIARIRPATGATIPAGARCPASNMQMGMCIQAAQTPYAIEQGVIIQGILSAIHTRSLGST